MYSTNDKKDRSIFFCYCFYFTHKRHFKNIVYKMYIGYIIICYLNESLFVLPISKIAWHIVFIKPSCNGTNIPDNTIFYFYGIFYLSRGSVVERSYGRNIPKSLKQLLTASLPSDRCECHGFSEMTIINQLLVLH